MSGLDALDWDKGQGLLPAIVQHHQNGSVLMLGYMSRESLAATQASGRVTFFSRHKQRLWTKGESSGHFLEVRSIAIDCDADTLLILAQPNGPVCHRGTASCFGASAPQSAAQAYGYLGVLTQTLRERIATRPAESYTAKLLDEGPRRIAQKVGEEGLELALASVAQDDAEVIAEAADLLYHVALLLEARGLSLSRAVDELARRGSERA